MWGRGDGELFDGHRLSVLQSGTVPESSGAETGTWSPLLPVHTEVVKMASFMPYVFYQNEDIF